MARFLVTLEGNGFVDDQTGGSVSSQDDLDSAITPAKISSIDYSKIDGLALIRQVFYHKMLL